MKTCVVLESDRLFAQSLKVALGEQHIQAIICTSPDEAIRVCDERQPDCIITELTLHSHSGTEFLYEFRSYPDWQETPVWVYTHLNVPVVITESADWRRFNVELLSKKDMSITGLASRIKQRIDDA